MNRRPPPDTPVRVIINGLHAKSGGGVTYLRNLLPHLAADKRLELHLFLHREQYKLFGEAPDGIRLHLLEFRQGFLRLLFWEQFALPLLAAEMGAEVTFSPANYGPLLAPAPVILLRNSLAVVQREYRLKKRLYWVGLAAATAASLLFARRAIAVSDYARRTLNFGLTKLFANKIEVIHHGVNEDFRVASANQDREPATLLAVSDIYVQKNLHTLIKALGQLRQEGVTLRLVVAGHTVDREYHQQLTNLIAEFHLGDSVEFLGGVSPERLAELYRQCTVFVFPSTVETFGNPLVEAMASAAPIACSRSAAMPEIVGDAAEYFEPLDIADMARAIRYLIENPGRRDELAQLGQARAAKYSWATTARHTAQVLFRAARGDSGACAP